ncbi:unnamed protein product [Cyclocybe aegerita]|uniref:DUF7918 domain-containing protein n=1 Tax=Cyclocybe aegerita TaxID=1973307 RepID=A0A8S0WZB4_CYCAE|nr:unnamed protein product [Cyclocybe aegerita]
MPTTRLTLGDYSACWIASEEGKAFTVDVHKLHKNFPCASHLHVDGNWMLGRVIPNESLSPASLTGTQTGLETEKPFLFTSMKLTDDDSFLSSSQTVRDIGEIKINVYRISNLQDQENPLYNGTVLSDDKKVHERAKKATEHRVKSGEEVKVAACKLQSCTRHEQVAKFVFRYRSSRMLQANGLMVREPSPVEESTSGKGDTRKRKSEVKEESEEEEEDTEEIEARQEEAELLARLESIRNARNARSQTKPPKKKIKEEPRPVFMRGEVIDLT